MIFYLIICSVLTAAVAQEPSLSCNYFSYNNGATYGCDLTLNNPNGLNNFTEIGGIHLEGFTNSDVNVIYRFTGISSNIPSIICETFPNIIVLDFYYSGLTEIDDSAFSGCSRIVNLGLYLNRISSISANAFSTLHDLVYIDLEGNSLTTLPENVFANQQNLSGLYLSSNPLNDFPVGIFRPLENLQFLYLGYANLTAVNGQWFGNTARLLYLDLTRNRIRLLTDSFVGLVGLRSLGLGYNGINEIPPGTFAELPNLQVLYLNGNNFTELHSDSFPDLEHLQYLEIGSNPFQIIHGGAFRNLRNLTSLSLSSSRLREINSTSFEGLENLSEINLNFNEIEQLPEGLFTPLSNVSYVGLWNNRLKTVNRNSFGTLTNLRTIDLDGNIVNALDRAIIDDAVNLDTLYFDGNLCANTWFLNFMISRAQYLPMLERCFYNMRYIVETTTEGDGDFAFFEGPNPGIAFRVNTNNEVQIALTPFSFLWTPTVEIFIGSTNNTRSIIRVNQERDVVTVPTPNILAQNQWNDFRVTWANQNILVFRGNDSFPFMSYTMQDFFPVNFYGLRAIETRASWSVQPFQW